MYMIMFILHDSAHLDDVVEAWQAAGVTGIVPVRYWKDRLGHTLIGIRTDTATLAL